MNLESLKSVIGLSFSGVTFLAGVKSFTEIAQGLQGSATSIYKYAQKKIVSKNTSPGLGNSQNPNPTEENNTNVPENKSQTSEVKQGESSDLESESKPKDSKEPQSKIASQFAWRKVLNSQPGKIALWSVLAITANALTQKFFQQQAKTLNSLVSYVSPLQLNHAVHPIFKLPGA
jgi:hypothetical protein